MNMVYGYKKLPPITTAGIYHNSDLGLISLSSDGSTWLTISDKNEGANTVYNYGDTRTASNSGKGYQRGNCGGNMRGNTPTKSSTRVNTSNYGPGNYYNDTTFRNVSGDWSSQRNDNLWGNTTNTNDARRGMCQVGFHIPTKDELSSLVSLWTTTTGKSTSNAIDFCTELKMPLSGCIDRGYGTWADDGSSIQMWSSTPLDTNGSYMLRITTSQIIPTHTGYKTTGNFIRSFKNVAVQPDISWTVIYS